MKIHYAETRYGFDWGSAKITRMFSDEKKGWVTLGVDTPKESLQIYVTKTGKVRVFSNGEWTPPEWTPPTPKGKGNGEG